MDIKNLFDDDRAVSPVIGVILMVAITVILAAVIGTFVLGLGENLQDTSPQASIGFDVTTVEVQNDDGGTQDVTAVTVTHESGDSVAASNINVEVNGEQAYIEGSSDNTVAKPFTNDVSAGSSATILAAVDSDTDLTTGQVFVYDTTASDETGGSDAADTLDIAPDASSAEDPTENAVGLESGDTVRVVWSSDTGDTSSTLGKFTLP